MRVEEGGSVLMRCSVFAYARVRACGAVQLTNQAKDSRRATAHETNSAS